MRNSHNIIKNSNLVHIKNTALQGDIIGFYMVCHENYPAGHWKEIQIWNHPFFLTFFLTRAPKYHISITMETGEDTYLILSVSTTTTSLTNLLNTSAGQNCCTVHFWKGLQIHYLWIWVSRSGPGDKKSIQWFLKKFIPATFRARATVRLQKNSRLPQFSRLTFAQDYFLTHLKNVLDCCLS